MNIFLQHLHTTSNIFQTWPATLSKQPYHIPAMFWTNSLRVYYYFLLSTHGSPTLCYVSLLPAVLSNPNIVPPDTVLPSPMKVCEQKFPIIQYFHLLPPSIYCQKLQWTKSGARLGFDCIYSIYAIYQTGSKNLVTLLQHGVAAS